MGCIWFYLSCSRLVSFFGAFHCSVKILVFFLFCEKYSQNYDREFPEFTDHFNGMDTLAVLILPICKNMMSFHLLMCLFSFRNALQFSVTGLSDLQLIYSYIFYAIVNTIFSYFLFHIFHCQHVDFHVLFCILKIYFPYQS